MNLIALWYDALGSEFGIILGTNDPNLACQRLYKARALEANDSLNALSLLQVDGGVWIINLEKANAAQRGSATE